MSDNLTKNIANALLKFNKKNLYLAAAFGLVLIGISNLLIPSEKETAIKDIPLTISQYCESEEERLENILSYIEGVGKVSVMLTVDGTEEYIYVREEKESILQDNDSKSSETENKYILVQNNGNKEALVKKVINPEISGVVVVCEGGETSSVREKVYNAVSVSLGIPSNRIYVDSLESK